MSQIHNDPVMNLDHYANNVVEPRPEVDEVPRELQNARLTSGTSRWKTAGRVALGMVTCGLSEIIRLAYLGITACCSSSRPAQAEWSLKRPNPDCERHVSRDRHGRDGSAEHTRRGYQKQRTCGCPCGYAYR